MEENLSTSDISGCDSILKIVYIQCLIFELETGKGMGVNVKSSDYSILIILPFY